MPFYVEGATGMNERLFFLAYKLPSLAIGALIIFVSLFVVLFAQGCVKTLGSPAHTAATAELSSEFYSSNPNALAAGIEEAGHVIGQDIKRASLVAHGGLLYVTSIAADGAMASADVLLAIAKAVGGAIVAVVRTTGHIIMFLIRTTADILLFIARIPLNIFGFIADSKVAHAIIAPSEQKTHNNNVPIIDPDDPALLAARQALPAAEPEKHAPQEAHEHPQEIAWPMHGSITTYFGERGRYYNPVHTGIDISDGNRSGVTPIKPFRNGTVVAAGRDGGLGNRVVVDHGSGITSVYAHLSSITVQVGQPADTKTTLGFQGSTGVSTGPHLHFEVRVNGQVADPLLFIAGRP